MTCRQSKDPLKQGFYLAKKSPKGADAGRRAQDLNAQPNADRLKLKSFSFTDTEV